MKQKERIEYSPKAFIKALNAYLDEFNIIKYNKFEQFLGKEFCQNIETWREKILERMEDKFTIVVVGEFKRGKSTLINALIGSEVLTTDVTTETVTVNKLNYGLEKTEAVLENGKRRKLFPEELKREKLEKILEQIEEEVHQVDIYREYEFLKNITIIDTPGTGDLMGKYDKAVEESLLQADVVIYVFSATSPISHSEQLFIKSSILPYKDMELFLVGNQADLLVSEASYKKLDTFLKKKMTENFSSSEVYLISALDELCKWSNKERPAQELNQVLSSAFTAFKMRLDKLKELKKDYVVTDKLQRILKMMIADLTLSIAGIENTLNMSDHEIVLKEEEVRASKSALVRKKMQDIETIASGIKHMKIEASDWMEEYLERMKVESTQIQASDISSEEIQKYYPPYYIDKVREGMEECLSWHREELYDNLESISLNIAKNTTSIVKESEQYAVSVDLNNQIWTKGDTLSFSMNTLFSGGIGRIISMTTDIMNGKLRKKEMAEQKENLLKKIQDEFEEIELSVLESIGSTYDNWLKHAIGEIEIFYEEKVCKMEQKLKQLEKFSDTKENEKKQITEALMAIREVTEKLQTIAE